jgi:hypothetical protein
MRNYWISVKNPIVDWAATLPPTAGPEERAE